MNITKATLTTIVGIATAAMMCTIALPAQATPSYTKDPSWGSWPRVLPPADASSYTKEQYPNYCLNNGLQTDKETTLYHG